MEMECASRQLFGILREADSNLRLTNTLKRSKEFDVTTLCTSANDAEKQTPAPRKSAFCTGWYQSA